MNRRRTKSGQAGLTHAGALPGSCQLADAGYRCSYAGAIQGVLKRWDSSVFAVSAGAGRQGHARRAMGEPFLFAAGAGGGRGVMQAYALAILPHHGFHAPCNKGANV